jgi:hypothetical protein
MINKPNKNVFILSERENVNEKPTFKLNLHPLGQILKPGSYLLRKLLNLESILRFSSERKELIETILERL